jgi:hypothetical protein
MTEQKNSVMFMEEYWACISNNMVLWCKQHVCKLATNELSKKLAAQQIEASTKICALIQCILAEK